MILIKIIQNDALEAKTRLLSQKSILLSSPSCKTRQSSKNKKPFDSTKLLQLFQFLPVIFAQVLLDLLGLVTLIELTGVIQVGHLTSWRAVFRSKPNDDYIAFLSAKYIEMRWDLQAVNLIRAFAYFSIRNR